MFKLLRRRWIIAVLALAVCGAAALAAAAETRARGKAPLDTAQLAAMAKAEEKRLGARIGIAVLDEKGGIVAAYRGDERFPLNSTHKPLLCAALLRAAEQGKVNLAEKVQFGKEQLVSYSPVTQNFIAPAALDWRQLCGAAIEFSDNTAANLIAEKLGGPAGLNRFLRSVGDKVTRLDRFEPALNSAIPGDERDTTTPLAVSRTLQTLLFGSALSPASRRQLTQWLADDKVAGAALRAVLPPHWKIADKTGAGGYGSRSIISAVWPAAAKPLVIAIYITQTKAARAQSDAVLARIGKKLFAVAQSEKSAP